MQRTQTKNHWINKRVMVAESCGVDKVDDSLIYVVVGTDYIVGETNLSELHARLLPTTESGLPVLGADYIYVKPTYLMEV